MAPRVQVLNPDGSKVEYPVYNDNRELAADFAAGFIWSGVEVIYRSMICEIMCTFEDEDGEKFCELIFKDGLGPTVTFSVVR